MKNVFYTMQFSYNIAGYLWNLFLATTKRNITLPQVVYGLHTKQLSLCP